MAFSRIDSISIMDQFVQQVQDQILSGEYKPGEMLPSARELATVTGVSRPVITAGLVELEKIGFVEVRPRVGTFVKDYRRTGTVETLNAIMRHNGKLRKHETQSLMQIRTALESLCVELVIANATDEELLTLQPIVDALKEAALSRNETKTAELTFQFHHELAVVSGNILLPLMYHSFKVAAIALWVKYCQHNGCLQLYANKNALYGMLFYRNLPETLKLVPGEYRRDPNSYDWPEE